MELESSATTPLGISHTSEMIESETFFFIIRNNKGVKIKGGVTCVTELWKLSDVGDSRLLTVQHSQDLRNATIRMHRRAKTIRAHGHKVYVGTNVVQF